MLKDVGDVGQVAAGPRCQLRNLGLSFSHCPRGRNSGGTGVGSTRESTGRFVQNKELKDHSTTLT